MHSRTPTKSWIKLKAADLKCSCQTSGRDTRVSCWELGSCVATLVTRVCVLIMVCVFWFHVRLVCLFHGVYSYARHEIHWHFVVEKGTCLWGIISESVQEIQLYWKRFGMSSSISYLEWGRTKSSAYLGSCIVKIIMWYLWETLWYWGINAMNNGVFFTTSSTISYAIGYGS